MCSIDKVSAAKLAESLILQISQSSGKECEIMHAHTQEIEIGWIFFYNSSTYIRTSDFSYALVGNGPILVRRDGSTHKLPTGIPWEDAIKAL